MTFILAATAATAASGMDGAPPAPRAPTAPAARGQIARLIDAARPGDTITIGPGVYTEHLVIDKPVVLVGEGRPVIDGGGSGDIIEITAPGVTVRGFTVRDTGIDLDKENAAIRILAPRATVEDNVVEDILFGIDLREAHDSVIRNNRVGGKDLDIARRGDGVRLWRSDRVLIEGNTIHDGRDAILWYSEGVIVRRNDCRRCRYGFHLMYSDSVTLQDNTLEGNSVGIYLMYSKRVRLEANRLTANRGPSGYGIGLKEVDQFSVVHNTVVGNRVGVYLDGSPFSTTRPGEFEGNTVAYNDVGIAFLPAVRGNRIAGNAFIDNIEQVCVQGRGELKGNEFSFEQRGNFWSDYTGYDQDQDGVGDFVHESSTLFENLLDKEPKLRILLFSPVQQAVELVGRALPATRPEPKFADEWPLMSPPAGVGVAGRPATHAARLGTAGVGMLLVGAAVVAAAVRATHAHNRTTNVST